MECHTDSYAVRKKAFPKGWLVRIVDRQPNWRGQPYSISYLLPDHEPTADELVDVHRWAYQEGFPNPRAIPPALMQWSSLFNPRFFNAVAVDQACDQPPLSWNRSTDVPNSSDLPSLWLESTLFLAGVTFSAAIVQSRYSSGTIASKYDHLWEAGVLSEAGVAPQLRALNLKATIQNLADNPQQDGVERLLDLRDLFLSAWKLLAPPYGEVEIMSQGSLSGNYIDRFGFLPELRAQCGQKLQAIIVYGSSISSENFADYDLLIVTDEPQSLLRRLAGTSPSWHGKEINMGVYSPDELIVMQRLSGDNLANYGICLWGAAPVVHKSTDRLLVRNFSFGIIRQRQQLGMLSRAIGEPLQSDKDDRRNLHDYFVKIPANVAKGTLGALGERWSKEQVQQWMLAKFGFDALAEQRRAMQGNPGLALAHSALATSRVLEALNEKVELVIAEPVPRNAYGERQCLQ